ncbi:hypothetical protein DL95DRAFT_504376 [Leptodontidium sp. 2 PMI_412]|nr:hypothetical protein DL95DRAFT_504376 [Leptodontidium sp. 2 PMI_412]
MLSPKIHPEKILSAARLRLMQAGFHSCNTAIVASQNLVPKSSRGIQIENWVEVDRGIPDCMWLSNDMAEYSEDKETTISECTIACVQAFERCLVDESSAEHEAGWMEDQMVRFNIWASNLGALARGHASADSRLRDGDEVRSLILQLLKAICRNLTFTPEGGSKDMHDGGSASSDEDHSPTLSTASFTFSSESSSDDRYVSSLPAPIIEARREVEEAISRLNRLSTSIRKSGVHYRDLKAISFVDMDQDGNNLTEYYSGLSLLLMNHKFPSAEPNFRDDLHTKPRPLSTETASNLEPSARDALPRETRPLLSITSASLFDPKTFNTNPRSTTSKAPSTVILGTPSQVATLYFPPEPKLAGQDYFQCRYCFLPCPAKEARGKAWKNHVMRDMAPYICTFQGQNCSKTNCFFQTLSEWLTHIRSEHAALQWECVAPAHDTLLFDDLEKYSDHMKQEHQDIFAASQLHTLAQKTARPAAEPFEMCPFCNMMPDDLVDDSHNSGHDVAQNDLKTHIALHLQSLALLRIGHAHILRSEDDNSVAAEAHSLGGVMEWAFIRRSTYEIEFAEDELLAPFIERYRQLQDINPGESLLLNSKGSPETLADLETPPNLPEGISPELIAAITEKVKQNLMEQFKATEKIASIENIGKLNVPDLDSNEHESFKQGPSVRQEDTKMNDLITKCWGTLFDPEGRPTQRLGQFLRGIANNLIAEYFPKNSLVVTTDKMATFYATYALDREPHPLLYLGCQHHLHQVNATTAPTMPALTAVGFAYWMTISIMAYPDEESERLSRVLNAEPIESDGVLIDDRPERLPKILTRLLLPGKEDRSSKRVLDAAIEALFDSLGRRNVGSDRRQAPKRAPPAKDIKESRARRPPSPIFKSATGRDIFERSSKRTT